MNCLLLAPGYGAKNRDGASRQARLAIGVVTFACWLFPSPARAEQLAPMPETPAATEPEASPAVDPTSSGGPALQGQPPKFQRLDPYRKFDEPVHARVGAELRFVVHAEDPSGLRLRYSARGLPPGAAFDPETQVFTFTPADTLRGRFDPIFVASNGYLEATLLVQIEVGENRAPVVQPKALRFQVDRQTTYNVVASDPDGDAISFDSESLPPGATINKNSGAITWMPTEGDRGHYAISITVSDGERSTTADYTVVVDDHRQGPGRDENEWESYLQPGLGYAVYLPGDISTYGAFHGPDLQLSLVSWAHDNKRRGPSHGRVYVSAQAMQSAKDELSPLFVYSLGLTLSLERNPQRRWLIPHYGVELGGMTQDEMGGRFQSLFFGGAHLWASRNFFVNAEAGYLLVPSNMDDLAGFVAAANIEFSLW